MTATRNGPTAVRSNSLASVRTQPIRQTAGSFVKATATATARARARSMTTRAGQGAFRVVSRRGRRDHRARRPRTVARSAQAIDRDRPHTSFRVSGSPARTSSKPTHRSSNGSPISMRSRNSLCGSEYRCRSAETSTNSRRCVFAIAGRGCRRGISRASSMVSSSRRRPICSSQCVGLDPNESDPHASDSREGRRHEYAGRAAHRVS